MQHKKRINTINRLKKGKKSEKLKKQNNFTKKASENPLTIIMRPI
jgi:hypothetical protein